MTSPPQQCPPREDAVVLLSKVLLMFKDAAPVLVTARPLKITAMFPKIVRISADVTSLFMYELLWQSRSGLGD